ARVRRRRRLAPARRHRRPGHDGRRGAARPAAVRPQAAPRLWHDQPARVPRRAVRHRPARGDRRRLRPAPGPRPVQGRPVHGGGHRRPRDRDPRRPPPAGPGRPRLADGAGGRGGQRRLDGRRPAARRVRRQGGGLRRARRRSGRRPPRAGRHRRRIGAHRRLQPAVRGRPPAARRGRRRRRVAGPGGARPAGGVRRPGRRARRRHRRAVRRPPRGAGAVRPLGGRPCARAPAPPALPGVFVAPAAVLSAATVVLGVAPAVWSGLVDHAAHALDGRAHAHLSLWHGPSVPLLLSAATLAAGAALFAARRPVAALQAATAPPVSGTRVYDAAVRGLLRGAARLTAVVQPGSLPLYAGVIRLTAAVATTVGLVSGPWWPGWPDAVGRTAHVPVAALLVVGAVASTVARRRFAAVMLLGVVGYAMAVLFVVQGAPDLALTPLGVETLFVVVFLLVLRQLPDRFEHRRTGAGRLVRLAVSAVVGVFVMVAAVAAAGSRTAEPVSRAMSEQAWPEGHGRNVVNVILV